MPNPYSCTEPVSSVSIVEYCACGFFIQAFDDGNEVGTDVIWQYHMKLQRLQRENQRKKKNRQQQQNTTNNKTNPKTLSFPNKHMTHDDMSHSEQNKVGLDTKSKVIVILVNPVWERGEYTCSDVHKWKECVSV